jgi:uncharacterized protein YndB with AHSA1/START domain
MANPETPYDRTVELSVHLDARPEQVWAAVTDQRALEQWFWPSRLQPRVTVDPRTGGRYRIASGAMGMAVSGRYLEATQPRRLVMSWRWDGDDRDSRVTLTLSGGADGTDLDLRHEALDHDAAALHRQGWSDCLERLPDHLAGSPAR